MNSLCLRFGCQAKSRDFPEHEPCCLSLNSVRMRTQVSFVSPGTSTLSIGEKTQVSFASLVHPNLGAPTRGTHSDLR